MASSRNSQMYGSCKSKRTEPDVIVDEELHNEISRNFRVLPSFENTVFERKYIKHYSLQRNELLKCRWKQYKDNFNRVSPSPPFPFPDYRDLHFYNNNVRFMPAVSVHRCPEYRRKLKPGPGVDFQGQMPIPQELLMKRGSTELADKEGRKKPI